MDNKFDFGFPIDLNKAETDEWFEVEGLASTDDRDLQGEILQQEGFDLSPIRQGKGYFNADHGQHYDVKDQARLGIIEEAELTEKGLWIKGKVFKNHPESMIYYNELKHGKPGAVQFSVEGAIVQRDDMDKGWVKRARIAGVALTRNPVNPKTYASLSKSLHAENIEEVKPVEKFPEIVEIEKSKLEEIYEQLKELEVLKAEKPEEDLEKAKYISKKKVGGKWQYKYPKDMSFKDHKPVIKELMAEADKTDDFDDFMAHADEVKKLLESAKKKKAQESEVKGHTDKSNEAGKKAQAAINAGKFDEAQKHIEEANKYSKMARESIEAPKKEAKAKKEAKKEAKAKASAPSSSSRSYDEIDAIMSRKATEFSEAQTMRPNDVSKETREFIQKLPILDTREVYVEDKVKDTENFEMKVPQWFILQNGKNKYIINTEGYEYPRYIARITDGVLKKSDELQDLKENLLKKASDDPEFKKSLIEKLEKSLKKKS